MHFSLKNCFTESAECAGTLSWWRMKPFSTTVAFFFGSTVNQLFQKWWRKWQDPLKNWGLDALFLPFLSILLQICSCIYSIGYSISFTSLFIITVFVQECLGKTFTKLRNKNLTLNFFFYLLFGSCLTGMVTITWILLFFSCSVCVHACQIRQRKSICLVSLTSCDVHKLALWTSLCCC